MRKEEEDDVFNINKRNIEKHIRLCMQILSENYTLKEVDAGTYKRIHIGEIDFFIKQYEIDNVGNLVVIESKDCKKIQMVSIVITPYYKNIPLFSTNYIYKKEKRNFLIEYYDLVKEQDYLYLTFLRRLLSLKEYYQCLRNIPMKRNWCSPMRMIYFAKAGYISDDIEILDSFIENLIAFIKIERKTEMLKDEDKKVKYEITHEYIDKLIEKGGVSTNLFRKILGIERTKEFFYKVFFGLENEYKKGNDLERMI